MAEFNARQLVEQIGETITNDVKAVKEQYEITPTLAIVTTGDRDDTLRYLNNKIKTNDKYGIATQVFTISKDSKSDEQLLSELYKVVKELNVNNNINAIIIQEPFGNLKHEYIKNLVNPKKDVDGFSDTQVDSLIKNSPYALNPCTALGVERIITETFGSDLTGVSIAILNRSKLIGYPLDIMLKHRNATTTLLHTGTNEEYKRIILKNADIVVTGMGTRSTLNSSDFSRTKTKLIVDCSMNKVEGILGVGDVFKEDVLLNMNDTVISSGYGQTGLLTTTMLAMNVVKATLNQNKVIN